uniref:Fibronectin type-III domain-containing protein n=1 Tax=Echinococcus canadensis TaxID=519352 RepID=A0A915F051_9CEST
SLPTHSHLFKTALLTNSPSFPSWCIEEARTEASPLASSVHLSRMGSDLLHFNWNVQTLRKLNVKYIEVTVTPSTSFSTYSYATASVSSGEVTAGEMQLNTLYNMTVEATGHGVYFEYHMGLIKTRSIGHDSSLLMYTFLIFVSTSMVKTGRAVVQNQWNSVLYVTVIERKYKKKERRETSVTYAVTVRRLVSSDISSEMADPLVFDSVPEDLNVPQNVKVQATDTCAVNMTWDLPAEPSDRNTAYTIEWSLKLCMEENYLSALKCFRLIHQFEATTNQFLFRVKLPLEIQYIGSRSKFVAAATPSQGS